MQVTIEIPDELAGQFQGEERRLAEVIQRGLAQPLSSDSALAEEIIGFLGGGPGPQQIIGFRPSPQSVRRADELLERNRHGSLSSSERAEINEICAWNRLFALIKAEARLRLQAAS